MKKTNKFAYIVLIIVIIIILILSYLLMSKNSIIQRQAEEIETMTATTDNAYALSSLHSKEEIKVWNKTYAYNDYTWEGEKPSKSGYVSLNNSTITINLAESEVIDVKNIQAWTLRLWANDDMITTDPEGYNGYKFRKARGTDQYWYELPVLHADYDPDLKLIGFENFGDLTNVGKIRKHMINSNYQPYAETFNFIGGTIVDEYEIVETPNMIDSFWCKPQKIGDTNYIQLKYYDLLKQIQIDFVKDTSSAYQVRGYIVADITIYYKGADTDHVHTGSPETGGGCYGKAIYHVHTEECENECTGQWKLVHGSHYVHKCTKCGREIVNSYIADQSGTAGAICTSHYGSKCGKLTYTCSKEGKAERYELSCIYR